MFYTKIAVIFGDGKQFQSWIHIEDVSAIFLFISKNKLLGNFNAVAPNPITNLEWLIPPNQLYDVLLNKNFETFKNGLPMITIKKTSCLFFCKSS